MERTMHQPVPSPPSGLLGARHGSRLPTYQWHLQIRREYGDVVHIRRFGPVSYYFISAPHDIERVLRANQRNYAKPRVLRRRFGFLLGDGLFTAEGAHWLHQRRLIQPVFHRQRLMSFAQHMTDAALDVAEDWSRSAHSGKPVDILATMMSLTLRVVSKSLFGVDAGREADEIRQAFETCLAYVDYRIRANFALPLFVPTPRNRRFRVARETLDREVYRIIQERRRSDLDSEDLLSMLLQVEDADTGEKMTNRQLRDEVITLMLAGHETSAVALSWIWYLLSQHVEVEQNLHAELDQVLGGGVPTVEDLPNLRYTRMVIDEALRLYPPAWMIARQSKADDLLGGYHIPAGTYILMFPYVTHRSPEYWADPELFCPDRFDSERQIDRPAFTYFPFGGGPRQCLGNGFALMEAQLVLATLAQRYKARVASGWQVSAQPSITLRPQGGLQMDLLRRDQ